LCAGLLAGAFALWRTPRPVELPVCCDRVVSSWLLLYRTRRFCRRDGDIGGDGKCVCYLSQRVTLLLSSTVTGSDARDSAAALVKVTVQGIGFTHLIVATHA
uniref:Secreted protein n=1 Tax=Taenia asiatica TaxID=60517 RepID=A0A0R3WGH9_TAEAS